MKLSTSKLTLSLFVCGGLLSLAVALSCHAQTTQAVLQEPSHLRDVVYGHKLGIALTMDVFKPAASAKPSGIGVVWMVSGGWYSNHEAINPALSKFFTDRGHTVFQVVHGSQPKFTLPEIVQDIHRAMRFIRGHAKEYGVDPERLGICGASAGGHLSLMMAAYGSAGDSNAKDSIDRLSSRPNAVAVFFPPTDFLNYGKAGQRALSYEELRPFWHVFAVAANATDEERNKVARTFSPLYGLSTTSPPIFLIHGDADTLVPLQQSQEVINKLEELKVPHKLVVRDGKGHGWPGLETDLALIADWFEEHLSKPASQPAQK
nr:EstJ [uncultured bacterium]